MLDIFLTAAALGVSAAISPGPFQSLVIAESLLGGWRRAAPVTFAPLVADIPIAVVLVFVLNQVPEAFLQVVRLGGAAMLMYLAYNLWKEIRAEGDGDEASAVPQTTARRGFLRGMAMLFLSPGTYLYWSLILGPLLLDALEQSAFHAVGFLASFYMFSIGGLLVIAAVLGQARETNRTVRRGLQMASLALLFVISGVLLASVITG